MTRPVLVAAGLGVAVAAVAASCINNRRRYYREVEDAALLMRDRLSVVDPSWLDTSPVVGCCGCGSWRAAVATAGEAYCWRCVDRLDVTGYTVLASQEQTTARS